MALSDRGFVIILDKAYMDACVTKVKTGLVAVEKISYPVMIKASEGGGGKGICMVKEPDAFKNAYHAVAGEVPCTHSLCDLIMPFLI